MAFDQINGTDFIAVHGEINIITTQLQDIRKADANGLAYKVRGSTAGATIIKGIRDVSDWAAAQTALATYNTWKGTVVNVRQAGQTRAVFLIDYKEKVRKMIANQVGGTTASNRCYTEIDFVVEMPV
jgi:hypothetical protein